MIIPTKAKVEMARLLYRMTSACRSIVDLNDEAEVRRAGANWYLDLCEGIDLSIYLFGAFERSTLRALRRLVRAGDTVLGIGANVGAYTLPLARRLR